MRRVPGVQRADVGGEHRAPERNGDAEVLPHRDVAQEGGSPGGVHETPLALKRRQHIW